MRNILQLLLIGFIGLTLFSGCAPTAAATEAAPVTEASELAATDSDDKAEGEVEPTAEGGDSNISEAGEATKPAESPITGEAEDRVVFPAANVSILPVPGYSIETSERILAMFAPGGSMNDGPAVILIAETIPEGETVAETVAGYQNNGATNMVNWTTTNQDVQGRASILIEYQYEGQIGREILIPISSTLSLLITCYAPPDQWETTAPYFVAVLDSLQFLP